MTFDASVGEHRTLFRLRRERETGFGPATYCLEGSRSARLSYSRDRVPPPKSSIAVAVGTDDIALCRLIQDPRL